MHWKLNPPDFSKGKRPDPVTEGATRTSRPGVVDRNRENFKGSETSQGLQRRGGVLGLAGACCRHPARTARTPGTQGLPGPRRGTLPGRRWNAGPRFPARTSGATIKQQPAAEAGPRGTGRAEPGWERGTFRLGSRPVSYPPSPGSAFQIRKRGQGDGAVVQAVRLAKLPCKR